MDSFRRLLNENNIRSDENNDPNFMIAGFSFELSPRSSISEISSQSEQSEGNKFRQLPCKVFLACGSCPYRDRCQVCISRVKYHHSLVINHLLYSICMIPDSFAALRRQKQERKMWKITESIGCFPIFYDIFRFCKTF